MGSVESPGSGTTHSMHYLTHRAPRAECQLHVRSGVVFVLDRFRGEVQTVPAIRYLLWLYLFGAIAFSLVLKTKCLSIKLIVLISILWFPFDNIQNNTI